MNEKGMQISQCGNIKKTARRRPKRTEPKFSNRLSKPKVTRGNFPGEPTTKLKEKFELLRDDSKR